MTDIPKLTNMLVDARKSRAWSQRELAQRLDMRQSQISAIEAGKRDIRIGTFVEISRCLGLELVLVPRSLLPAVQYLLRSGETTSTQTEEETSIYETWKEED